MAAAEVVDPNRLSYDRGPSAPSLLESTIGANLAATAARYGHREALVDMVARRRFNYSELLTDVHRLATGLVRAGIGPGDRVGSGHRTGGSGCSSSTRPLRSARS